uniref:Sushi domain-containing protein n=1 Tax=Salvator merianae TaxID=96440 RepID=A0A8D0BRA4_SALMN
TSSNRAKSIGLEQSLPLFLTTERYGCGRPMPVENAEVMEGDQTGTRLRYSCVKNYKRKAGTSSLIVCKEDEKTRTFQWTPAQLKCIIVMTTSTPGPEETETSTPAPPKTAGVNPLGSRSTSQTASSPGTALPRTSTPVQEASLPYSPGTVPGNATVWETPTTTQVSELRTSKHTPAGHRETDVPPKGATGSPPQLSNPDSPQGLTGWSPGAEA